MAYSSIEDKYLSALTAVQFPDTPLEPDMPEQSMPGRQPGDILLAEAGSRGLPEQAYSGRYPDTIKPYDPTVRERLAGLLQSSFEGLGMDRYKARQNAQTLIGGGSSNLPLNIGLADFVPFLGTGLQTEEAIDTGKEAITSAQQGNYGTAALQGGAAVLGLVPGVAGTVKAAKPLVPKAAEMVLNSMDALGTPISMGAVPLEKYSSVTASTAAKVDKGSVKLSDKVAKGQVLQLAPEYRVKVTGAYKPEGKTQNIPNAVNPGNYEEAAVRLDDLAVSFPDPLESPERFSAMLTNVYNSNEVPIPPRWMIENANDMPKWSNWFGQMTKGQLDEANRGFAVVDKFKQIYTDGTASPETTGRLMMWAMLSRRASAYPHESGFLDLAESMTPLIQKALRGEYGQADIDAGLQMIKQSIPSGSPGNMVTSNANDFLRTFLPKMSEKLPDGRTKLQALHDMIADPNMTGPQIRRAFYGLAQDVGIKNKVLSFALLVSGREDVMVLDRIQINRLFAGGEKIYDDVAHLFDGGPGLAIYEGLERSLGSRVNQLYTNVGRADQASLGRYHWESWVLSSGQEVAHPTLETIVKSAKGETNPFANVPVKEGRMHERAFGISYERTPEGGNKFVFPTAKGDDYEFTKPGLDALFEQVMDKKNGIIPADFPGVKYFSKDTLPDGSTNPYFGKPWYSWPGVNRDRIDELAATFGTKINTASGAGSLEATVASQAAGGSVGAKRAAAGKRTSVKQGRQALQSGAE
ncbi:hypothetical protein UFOVP628_17 [uncultured Caudovirales phage]|uniref:Uncharacterized protein n=1 Tax=uncultured Caudovirales phage TaxID=2100421 RepID=A0A6J5N998_9CAUD|nr:hypothetical protein UFOVP628_17 [uncultured Caudovirales phage]